MEAVDVAGLLCAWGEKMFLVGRSGKRGWGR